MSVTPKALIASQYASATPTTQYTAPANTSTIIDKFTVTNVSGSSATLTVLLVPFGNLGATQYTIISALSVATGATTDITQLQNQILTGGDFISVLASASSSLVIRASGRECV